MIRVYFHYSISIFLGYIDTTHSGRIYDSLGFDSRQLSIIKSIVELILNDFASHMSVVSFRFRLTFSRVNFFKLFVF